MITDDVLRQIMSRLPQPKRVVYLPFLQSAMAEFEINAPLREAAFLAQLAHESAELKFMEEIASGSAYEGRLDLGNTQPGDGKRFKGRGPIQLTGRANYQRYGGLLGVDLISNPPLAATPEVAFRIAGLYWKRNNLNELADKQMFKTITKRINGGFNGLADRVKYYGIAKRVLGIGDTRGDGPPPDDTGDDSSIPVFTRGSEEAAEMDALGNLDTGVARTFTTAGTRGRASTSAPQSGAGKDSVKSAVAKKASGSAKNKGTKKAAKSKVKTASTKKAATKAATKKSAAKKSGAKTASKKSAVKAATRKAATKKGGSVGSAAKKSSAKSAAKKSSANKGRSTKSSSR